MKLKKDIILDVPPMEDQEAGMALVSVVIEDLLEVLKVDFDYIEFSPDLLKLTIGKVEQ